MVEVLRKRAKLGRPHHLNYCSFVPSARSCSPKTIGPSRQSSSPSVVTRFSDRSSTRAPRWPRILQPPYTVPMRNTSLAFIHTRCENPISAVRWVRAARDVLFQTSTCPFPATRTLDALAKPSVSESDQVLEGQGDGFPSEVLGRVDVEGYSDRRGLQRWTEHLVERSTSGEAAPSTRS